jgi:hypothetical protein
MKQSSNQPALNYTQAEARKEINAIAKKEGFIMRKQGDKLNGRDLYWFGGRASGKALISNMTFWNAYSNALCVEQWKE